jgi:glycosyltransferase involved in cell wall biosynthesis
MKKIYLSIVVPAYKEEKTIVSALSGINNFLSALNIEYEIICVVDGLVDRTFEKASKIKNSRLRVLSYNKNF